MTAQADGPHPDIMEPDLRCQASRHDHAKDQEGPEMDDVDEDEADFAVFDFDIAHQDDSVPDPEDLPSPPTRAKILIEQRHDAFCQQVPSRQGHHDRAFFEGADGLLRRRHPVHDNLIQVVLPESLRPRLLQLAHYAIVDGHPASTGCITTSGVRTINVATIHHSLLQIDETITRTSNRPEIIANRHRPISKLYTRTFTP